LGTDGKIVVEAGCERPRGPPRGGGKYIDAKGEKIKDNLLFNLGNKAIRT